MNRTEAGGRRGGIPRWLQDRRTLLTTVAVAAAYYATGRLGLYFAIPPGYATAIWPPSGIALATALLYSGKIWPGIWLGSFLINVGAGLDFSSSSAFLESLAIPAVIGSGAALQAVLGAWLVKRFLGFPNDFSEASQVARFLAFGGPIACLVNSSIAVGCLYVAGRVPLSNVLFNWATWWSGDTVGVLVFGPLTIAWLSPLRDNWQGRRLPITLWLGLSFGLCVALVEYTVSAERTELKNQLGQQTRPIVAALRGAVLNSVDSVQALSGFLTGVPDPTPEQFSVVASGLRKFAPAVQALEWIPKVSAQDRAAFEASMHAMGVTDFEFKEKSGDRLIRAGDRQVYYPVAYADPLQGNAAVVGYDLGSNDERRRALEQARDTGSLVASASVSLVQGGNGFLIIAPIYYSNQPHDTLEQRRRNIAGYALGVFRFANLVGPAFQTKDLSGLDYWMIDETAPGEQTTLLSNNANAAAPFRVLELGVFGARFSLGTESLFDVGGRHWVLQIAPTQAFVAAHRPHNSWAVLVGGLLLTSLVGAFVMVATGREAKFRALFENNPLPMWTFDRETLRFVEVNDTAVAKYGYSRDEFKRMRITDIRPEGDVHRLIDLLPSSPDGYRNVGEWRHRLKDGTVIDVEIASHNISIGGRILTLVIASDITQRKLAERARQQSEESYRSLAEGSIQGILIHDEKGKALFVNHAFATMHGFEKPEEVLALDTVDSLIPPDDYDRIMGYRRAQFRGEPVPPIYEARRLKRDGTSFWLDNRSQLIAWDGKPAIQSVVVDITERKQAEEALRESEETTRLIVDTSLDAVVAMNSNGEITTWNAQAETIFGWSQQEALGQSLAQLIVPERYREAHQLGLQRFLMTGEGPFLNKLIELQGLRRDGSEFPVELSISPAKGTKTIFSSFIRDITELKKAEEELRRSEHRFRLLTDIASDWHWETDADFRVKSYSKDYDPSVIGGRGKVIGRTLWEIAGVPNPAEDERWASFYSRLQAHEPIRDFEYSLISSEGRILYCRASGQPLLDSGGLFSGYLFASRDETIEVEGRAKVRAAEEMLLRAIESIPNGIAVYDSSDRLTLMNGRYKSLFLEEVPEESVGRTFEELIRKEVARGYYPDAVGREEEFVQQRLTAHRRSGAAFLYRIKSGQWMQALDTSMPDGSSVCVRSDVTQLVQAEERFRTLTDNLPGVVYRRIVSPNGYLQDIYVSPRVKELLGVDANELISGRATLVDFLHPDDRDRELGELHEAAKALRPLHIEVRKIARPTGAVRWWQIHAMPTRLSDGTVQFDGIALDITDRHATEEQLKQSLKMEAVGRLTGGIAHDFNNMLTVILNAADELETRFSSDARGAKLLEYIMGASERAADLTKSLLAFARKQPLQPRSVNINEFVGRLKPLLERTLGEDIDIELRLESDLWDAYVDVNQVEAAVLNLGVNARDAMPDGGHLTIVTANLQVDEKRAAQYAEMQAGPYITLNVSDDGCGMSPDVLAKATEPFFTTKGPGRGTGLGLSMVHGFVKQSGGHMSIYSEVGHGTTVRLYFPRAEAEAPRLEAAPERPVLARGHETILIVEDNADVRDIAVGTLLSQGYTVLQASDGRAALALADSVEQIDLLFTDIVMPGGMNGPALFMELRKRRPALKVLYTSGYTEDAIIHQGRLEEGTELLQKPYRRHALAAKVRAVLDRHPAAQ